jgi:dihydroflavonol-4-reductase
MTTKTAFVTGATGLLGNNLVRALLKDGYNVRAMARSREKAEKQFSDLGSVSALEIVEGDLGAIESLAPAFKGVDVLFHTAAYFRDSYKGGNHWQVLYDTNITGTLRLLNTAYSAGVRQLVHASSSAVLMKTAPGVPIDETMRRPESEADDYYKSKILTDKAIDGFTAEHPDFKAVFILPGWMHGPGDLGPTSAGQFVLEFMNDKLPGIIDSSLPVIDARDVAKVMVAAATKGRNGERYLAAKESMTLEDLYKRMEKVSGKQGPKMKIPTPLLWVVGAMSELYAKLSGKPVLVGLAAVKLLVVDKGHPGFNPAKGIAELGATYRPVEETLHDVLTWYRKNGFLPEEA